MTPCRVLVDAHMLGGHETGNERYVSGLLSGLVEVPDVRVAAAVTPGAPIPAELADAPVEWLELPSAGNWARLARNLPGLAARWRADVLHATYVAPFTLPCPLVLAVHDVSFRRFPEMFSWRDRVLFRTLVPVSLRRARAIVTCSDHARTEIEHFFPSLAAEVHAVPLAVSAAFHAAHDEAARADVRRRFGTGDRFVLTAGTAHPRKNLVRLVHAFAAVVDKHTDCRLVVCGTRGAAADPLRHAAAACGLESKVVFPGYLDDADLRRLYDAASVFVYPSLYEGFGLPVLEAMASGVPVVASRASSLPEVAGESAVLIDPESTSDIAAAIGRLLDDRAFAAELAARGVAHARRFTWRETASRTADVYRRVMSA